MLDLMIILNVSVDTPHW